MLMDQLTIKESDKNSLLNITPASNNSVAFLTAWLVKNKQFICEQLTFYGGIFFQGFTIKTTAEFEAIANAIDNDLADKHIFDGDVGTKSTKFVSDVASPNIREILTPLSLHNEDSFVAETPTKIIFCSLKSAVWGGESLVADCRKVYQSLPQVIRLKYRNQKLTSTLVLEDQLFLANSQIPKNVQAIIDLGKLHGANTVERIAEDKTKFSFTVPASIQNKDNIDVWFNTLHQAVFYNNYIDIWQAYSMLGGFINKIKATVLIIKSILHDLLKFIMSKGNNLVMHSCKLANGEKITAWEKIQMNLAFWRNTSILKLQDGDFFVLNNRLVAHGRMPYKGTRLMVSAMTQPTPTNITP